MGGCFSKPSRSESEKLSQQAAGKQEALREQQVPPAGGVPEKLNNTVAAAPGPANASVDSWSPADVVTWAAGLGLGPQGAAALQGVDGKQLLQLTDKGLLQLGVQDAAERQALLAARRSLQLHAGAAAEAGEEPQQQSVSKTLPDPPASTVGDASGPLKAQTGPAAPAVGQVESSTVVSPREDSQAASKQHGVRFAIGTTGSDHPDSAAEAGSGKAPSAAALDHLPESHDRRLSADGNLNQGEVQTIQVLRITSNGRLFRHNRPVPMLLVPFCQALSMLHDLRRCAHYNSDNCHQLLQRCVLVQDYLLALPLSELLLHSVLLSQLSQLVQDAYDIFSQFSERGWLLRLLGPVQDQEDFNRLDEYLVTALRQAGVDTSEPPLIDLSTPRRYQPQQQLLEGALRQLGGINKLLRDPLSATIRLQSLMHHLPSGSNVEALVQQEIDFYLSSSPQSMDSGGLLGIREEVCSPGNSATALNGLWSAAVVGGTSSGSLRRSSSSGPSGFPRVKGASHMPVEPYMVLRNDTVRSEWRSAFAGRERVTWREFWHKMVHPQAHIWGLDGRLDKFATDYVQQHLQRGSHGLLTLAELDFAFPPNVSPAMVVSARMKGHAVSSAGLAPVNFGGTSSSKPNRSPGGVGWLRGVRLLQDPNPRLHNFPEFPASYQPRDEELSELVLSMADVSTNLVMLTGAQGVGRSMLAASLAQELVNSQHWTDAYWIDLQGVTNVVLAGQQLMAGLGLISDVSDTQQLLAWLEGRPRERFGIVLTHVQELVMAPAEEHQGFLALLDNILHSSHKLQVVVVCEEALPRITYSARSIDVSPLTQQLAAEMVREAQPAVTEEQCQFIVDICSGAPVALAVVCGLLRYGISSPADFIRIFSHSSLPLERSASNTSTTSCLPFDSRVTNERLQRVLVAAAITLPDKLLNALLVLSIIPAPISFDIAAQLLALANTTNEKHSVMRQLVNLQLLSYNASLQQYCMHKLVREAAQLLVHHVGLPYAATRCRYAEILVGSACRLVLPLVKKNRMLSARLAWSRLAVHFVQLLGWAFQEVPSNMLSLYVSIAWDLMPVLSSSCGSHTLQGFCQVVLERSQFLDANIESAKIMTVLASLLAESGALKRADTLLRQALELFWRETKDPSAAVARCYRELGALMLKAGKAAEAAKQLQQALEIKEPLFGSTSSELLTVLQLQVELLRRSRKYAEAEGVCQRALGICGAAYGPADVQVAFWKNQLAQVLRQAGRLPEAQSLSEEALALLQGQLGSEHPRVAAQLMILGQLSAQQGKQAVAEQTLRKALQVYQSVSGLHHPDTFNCLTSLVALLRGAGKASQALPLAQRCLAVKKTSLGELHPDTAASMQVVADVMLDLGRYAEVETHCNRAVFIYQQINQPANSKPVITATTMQALALVLLGRASEAEQLAISCLEAAKQLPGPAAERSSFVASCYNCMGEVLREMGRLAEAESAAREGLAMREKDMGPRHPVVAISLQTLGHVLRLRQQLPEALEMAQRCEALRSASSSQAQGPQMAAALHLQALIYLDMGDYATALSKAQAGLALRQKVLSNDHPEVAQSLTVVSEILLLQNKHSEADPLLSHAVQIFIAQLGSSHAATQRAHMLLKQATNPRTASSTMSMAMRLASTTTATDLDSSRTASRDLSPSTSMGHAAATSAAAAAAVVVGAAAGAAAGAEQQASAAAPAPAEGGSSQRAGSLSAAEGKLAAAPGSEAGAAALGADDAAIKERRPSVVSAATTATGVEVSISTHIEGTPDGGAGYMGMQPNSTDSTGSTANSGARHPDGVAVEPGGAAAAQHAPVGSSAVAASEAGPPLAAAAGPAVGHIVEAAADENTIPSSSVGSLAGGITAAAQPGAPAPANPAEWELGRQFGQPAALTSGTADADAGAYTMVLAELTRRASKTEAAQDEDHKGRIALHEEGLPSSSGTMLPDPKDMGLGQAAAGPASSQEGAAGAGAAQGAATALATAAAQGGQDQAQQLEKAAEDAAAAADADADEIAAQLKETDSFVSKIAKLQGIGDVDELSAFLREHGWQLSRLSDDREAGVGRARPGSMEASRDQQAAGDGAAFVSDKLTPLPAGVSPAAAAAAAMDADAAAGGEGDGLGLPMHQAGMASGPVGGLYLSQHHRRPPARHYSFVSRGAGPGTAHLEAVMGGQMAASPRARRYVGPAGLQTVPGYEDAAWQVLHAQGMLTPGRLNQTLALQQALHQAGHEVPGWNGWTDGHDMTEQEHELEQYQYQQHLAQEAEAALSQQLHAEQSWPYAAKQPGPHGRSRSFASQALAHTITPDEMRQYLNQLRHQYGAHNPYADDEAAIAAAAAAGLSLPSGALGRHVQSAAWTGAQPMQQQTAAGYGAGRGSTQFQRGAGRRRRQSYDAASGPSHLALMAQAAAAAAAACGYSATSGQSNELEQLQLQQQHLSSVLSAQQQFVQAHSLPMHSLPDLASAALPAPAAAPAIVQGHGSAATAGSGGSRGSVQSGAAYGYGQQPGASGLVSASSGAQGAMLQGQRSSSTQYSSFLSPTGSTDVAALSGTAAPPRPASAGMPSGVLGALPKYPSNLSNYSTASGGSARSMSANIDGPGAGHAFSSGSSHQQLLVQQQQQQQQEELAEAAAAAGMPSASKGQQQHNLIAAKARSALNIGRQGSGQFDGPASPRQQQLQPGSDLTGPPPPSGRSSRGTKRSVTFPRQAPTAAEEEQQLMDGEGSPRHAAMAMAAAAAAAGHRGMSQQLRQQHLGMPRSPNMQPQQAHMHDDAHMYGPPMPNMYLGLAAGMDEGYWQGDQLHSDTAAGMSSGSYALPGQHGFVPSSGPASTGSARGANANLSALAAALGANPQALMHYLRTHGGNPHAQQLGGPEQSWDEDYMLEQQGTSSRVEMLQQKVLEVQQARRELENQQHEIEQLLHHQPQLVEQLQQLAQLGQMPQPGQMPPRALSPATPGAGLPVLGFAGPGGSGGRQQQRAAAMPHVSTAAAGDMSPVPSPEGYMAGGLQHAASTASSASMGSPRGGGQGLGSARGFRSQAAVAAVAAGTMAMQQSPDGSMQAAQSAAMAGLTMGPDAAGHAGPESAQGAAGAAAEEGPSGAGAVREGQLGLMGNGHSPYSSMQTPGSSVPPSSPSASSSLSSRPALSRGASDNHEAQMANAAAVAAGTGTAAAVAAGRVAAAGPSSKGMATGQPPVSPEGWRRPGTGGPFHQQAQHALPQQQRGLHRLHRNNSSDLQPGDGAEAAMMNAGQMASMQRAASAGAPLQRSPTNAPPRAPMPAAGGWQQQQQQQAAPQQYAQAMLAQQQQQQQRQALLAQQNAARRPARMSSPSMPNYMAAPTSPVAYPAAPVSLAAVSAFAMTQQQQLPLPHGASSNSLRVPGLALGPQAAAAAASFGMGPQPPHPRAGFAGPGRGQPSPAGMAAGGTGLRNVHSFSAGMPSRPMAPQQLTGVSSMGAPGAAHMPHSNFSNNLHSNQQLLQQQIMQQQQMIQQQQQFLGAHGGPAAALAAAGYGMRGGQQYMEQVHMGEEAGESEDYAMWGERPDWASSRDGQSSSKTSASRSFLAANGGQYWQGRRSNSWTNVQDAVAAGQVTSPHSLPRSRSSDEIPTVGDGGHASQESDREAAMAAVMQMQPHDQ